MLAQRQPDIRTWSYSGYYGFRKLPVQIGNLVLIFVLATPRNTERQ